MSEFLYDVDEDGSTLLHLAVESGSKAVRKRYLSVRSVFKLKISSSESLVAN